MEADEFWLEQVREARTISPGRKAELAGELFDLACSFSLAGIRFQNPGISDSEAMSKLRERLSLGAILERQQ